MLERKKCAEMYSDGKCERYDKEMCEDVQGQRCKGWNREDMQMYRGEDARDRTGKGDLQSELPRSLIVLLEVTRVDRLRLLNLVHVVKSYYAA